MTRVSYPLPYQSGRLASGIRSISNHSSGRIARIFFLPGRDVPRKPVGVKSTSTFGISTLPRVPKISRRLMPSSGPCDDGGHPMTRNVASRARGGGVALRRPAIAGLGSRRIRAD